MKTTSTSRKTTIVFFIVSLFVSLLAGCKPADEPLIKSIIVLKPVKNITATSVTLGTTITPNQENTIVSFEYNSTVDGLWKTKTLENKYSGINSIELNLDLLDLQPSTKYNFRIKALNVAGEVISAISSFTTAGLTKAFIKIKDATDIKINSVKLNASVVANQDNTSIAFEYQIANSAWVSKSLGSNFSGTDSAKVNLNLADLQANTLYNFRVRVTNKAGEVISDLNSFNTYAVADYDGNYYHTVTIGTQTWLKENLKTTHYANGDPIPNIRDPEAWANLKSGAYCWYNNDSNTGKIYGGLYNWYVASDLRGFIQGWHVPISDEWNKLKDYLGGGNISVGIKLMEAGLAYWNNQGNNSSGFTALPNGEISADPYINKFVFSNLGSSATLYSSDLFMGFLQGITIQQAPFGFINYGLWDNKANGFGIRLLKDSN